MSNYVPGEGPTDAKIIIVGEAPGAAEDLQRRPFVGPSGSLLNAMLSGIGLSRKSCYLTNIIKQRPLGNNFGVFYKDSQRNQPSEKLEKAIEALHQEIKRIKPNVVLALGGEPLRALTGKHSITKWRGSILWNSNLGVKIVPTYHPAFVMRMYSTRAIAELDMRKALKESLTSSLDLPKHKFIIDPSYEQICEILSRPFKRLAVDIETVGKGFTRCVGIAWSKSEALCIPLMVNKYSPRIGSKTIFIAPPSKSLTMNSRWAPEVELDVLRRLKNVLENPKIEKVLQNFPFDSTVLSRELGISIRGLCMDTLVAQHCCYIEFPKSLDFLCSVYTRVPRYSDHDASVDLEVWRYNCYDCCVDFEVCEALELELEEHGMTEFYKYHAEPLMYALARIGNRGVLIDLKQRKKLTDEAKLKLLQAIKRLHELCGYKLNPNSPKQVKEFLYTKLGLRPQFHPKRKTITVEEDALLDLTALYPQHLEVLATILLCRQQRSVISKVLEAEPNERNRLITAYNANGTVTGRTAASKTIFGEGVQLQNINRGKVRSMFVSPEGKLFIKGDLRQAEARAVAWFAGISSLIKRFLCDPDFDIHRWNASSIHNISEGAVTKLQRQDAKKLTHGADYRVGSRTTARAQRVPYAQAKHALERYLEALPELKGWWVKLEQELNETRTFVTPMGRKRIFFGRMDHATYREATAYKPQSIVGDIVNRALVLAEFAVQFLKPVLLVHDEIDCEVEAFEKNRAVKALHNILEYPLEIKGVEEPLLIPAEIKVGSNWYDVEAEEPQ